MTEKWPKQTECNAFYGNPKGINGRASPKWESENLCYISPPFKMTYDGQPVKKLRVHKKCADSLSKILNNLWEISGKSQQVVDTWGVSIYGGAYNYRLMRGGGQLSMHSWGCAIDLDPARNGFHDTSPNFKRYPQVIKAFEDEGWTWGGRWSGRSCDGMHFQAART